MRIHVGYEISYHCPKPTPAILTLRVHPSRAHDLEKPDEIATHPALPVSEYIDGFGNLCTRLTLPPGLSTVTADTIVRDSGIPDPVVAGAAQHPIEALPSESLVYLLGSRYCETDRLMETAWSLFGTTLPGWARVQAICDYVHRHVSFGHQHARPTKTASDVHIERAGVCRDFAHLAVTFCRCMNIPARYATGYLGDIGVPLDPTPMDFSAWFEVFLDGRWYAFDARHNRPRIGRILIAIGRDASDVAISNSFGLTTLSGFRVWTHELPE
jgi:transglutaminase-like putative cysteine protease